MQRSEVSAAEQQHEAVSSFFSPASWEANADTMDTRGAFERFYNNK